MITASTRAGEGVPSDEVVCRTLEDVGAGIWSVGGNLTVGWKDDVLFSCRVVGNPDPEVMWSHRGKTIARNRDRYAKFSILPDGTLRIVDTQKTDTGTYICIATNIHGSDKVIYNLKNFG
ncbi:Down syndrome cell adhesion molecule-like protein 1 [Armadillidium vulgare]|nr:Down syndrome cell adhesion molecule-like protein 1 [Armadillidium vulgare]